MLCGRARKIINFFSFSASPRRMELFFLAFIHKNIRNQYKTIFMRDGFSCARSSLGLSCTPETTVISEIGAVCLAMRADPACETKRRNEKFRNFSECDRQRDADWKCFEREKCCIRLGSWLWFNLSKVAGIASPRLRWYSNALLTCDVCDNV